MRIYAIAGALLGWSALVLQLYLILIQSPPPGGTMLGTVITFFSFFTILTNLLVALVFTALVLRAELDGGSGYAARQYRLPRLHTLPSSASSTSCCCGGYGTPKARNGLLTYFCTALFRLDTSFIGCSLGRGTGWAGRTR